MVLAHLVLHNRHATNTSSLLTIGPSLSSGGGHYSIMSAKDDGRNDLHFLTPTPTEQSKATAGWAGQVCLKQTS
jgi:hypothetical protein